MLFLLFFLGIYNYYEIHYSSYFNQSEYIWYSFDGNQGTSPTSFLLLSGFKSPINFFYSTIISLIFCLLVKPFTPNLFKKRWLNILIITFSWTVLLAVTYLICHFILNKFIYKYPTQFNLEIIKKPLFLLMILYFILIWPIVAIFNKHISSRHAVRTT
jgi:hypothetical protein